MSWLEKLLNKKNIISTRKAAIPEGYGLNALPVIRPCTASPLRKIWRCVQNAITI